MSEYNTTGPYGGSRCLRCSNDISGDVEGPYCSERCRHVTRSPRTDYKGTAEGVYPNPHVDETR